MSEHSQTIADRFASGGNLTVDQFAEWAGICRAMVYKEIAKGTLRAIKIGKCTRIPVAHAIAWQGGRPAILARQVA